MRIIVALLVLANLALDRLVAGLEGFAGNRQEGLLHLTGRGDAKPRCLQRGDKAGFVLHLAAASPATASMLMTRIAAKRESPATIPKIVLSRVIPSFFIEYLIA